MDEMILEMSVTTLLRAYRPKLGGANVVTRKGLATFGLNEFALFFEMSVRPLKAAESPSFCTVAKPLMLYCTGGHDCGFKSRLKACLKALVSWHVVFLLGRNA